MSNQKTALSIAAQIEKRLNGGSDEHGNKPINQDLINNDPRDWLQEAYEEALDLVFYLYAALERRRNICQNGEKIDLVSIRGNSPE